MAHRADLHKMTRSILTDPQFWIPLAVLAAGIALLFVVNRV